MLHMGLARLRDMSLETPVAAVVAVAAAAVFLPYLMMHRDLGRPNGVPQGIEAAVALYKDQGEDS
jgi:hypothetical protein